MITDFRISGRLPRTTAVLATSLLITACEAPLDLNAVRSAAEQPSKRTDFYQAMARNDQTIVVAGNDGVLLTSADEGTTWKRRSLATQSSFLAMDTCPDGSFIALTFDNQIWQGNPTGEQWSATDLPSAEQMMTVACGPNQQWLTAGSFTTVQISEDQGASWEEASLYEDAIINNLQFLNDEQAIATGEYGLVLLSEDGGLSWDIAGYAPDEFYIHTSHFLDADTGYIGGLNGFIYYTTDGGNDWQQMPADTQAPVFGFVAIGQDLFALADNATVLRLENERWVRVSASDQPLYLRAGVALADQRLLVAGGRGLLFDLDLTSALTASKD